MDHTLPDGFPVTFNLHDAALISGTTPSTLRSYLHREILRHVGQTPLAGQERRFTVTGLIEIGLVDRFKSSGIPLQLASQFVDSVFRNSFAMVRQRDIGKLDDIQSFSFSAFMKVIHDRNFDTAIFDMNPRYFLSQEMWANRDWQNPFIILARHSDHLGVSKVSTSVIQGWPKAGEFAGDGFVVHVLNLTRVMLNLEMAIRKLREG